MLWQARCMAYRIKRRMKVQLAVRAWAAHVRHLSCSWAVGSAHHPQLQHDQVWRQGCWHSQPLNIKPLHTAVCSQRPGQWLAARAPGGPVRQGHASAPGAQVYEAEACCSHEGSCLGSGCKGPAQLNAGLPMTQLCQQR